MKTHHKTIIEQAPKGDKFKAPQKGHYAPNICHIFAYIDPINLSQTLPFKGGDFGNLTVPWSIQSLYLG